MRCFTSLLMLFFLLAISLEGQISVDFCDQIVFARTEGGKQEWSASTKMYNIGTEKVDMSFKIDEWYIPKDWHIYLQFKKQQKRLYPNLSEENFTISPGETIEMRVIVQSRNVEGEGMLSIKWQDKSIRKESMLNTFVFAKSDPFVNVAGPNITILPNPASDSFITYSNRKIKRIEVFNILGWPQRTFLAAEGSSYNISDLAPGIYLVKFLSAENNVLRTVRLQKQ